MAGGNVQPDDIVRIVKNVSSKAAYPISSFDELAKILGGENANVSVGGRDYTVGHNRHLLPSEVFPIASEDDFIRKITYLQSQSTSSIQGDVSLEKLDISEDEGSRAAPSGPWC